MKKFIFICLAACIGLMGCEKNEEVSMMPEGFGVNSFWFMVCDANGNSVFDHENLNVEELILEYEGKIFTPIPDVHQSIHGSQQDKAGWTTGIIFEPYPSNSEGFPVTWRVWGHTLVGESARYILRYKDNEWICDYSSKEPVNWGDLPDDELYVNGEKVEKIHIYTSPDHPDFDSEEERMVWVYPLYVK